MKVKIFYDITQVTETGVLMVGTTEYTRSEMKKLVSEVIVKQIIQSSARVGNNSFATCFSIWYEEKEVAEVQKEVAEAPKTMTYAEHLNSMLDSPSEDLGFSTRVANILITKAGLMTVRAICKKSPSELLKYHNFGKTCLKELQVKLPPGLELGMADV